MARKLVGVGAKAAWPALLALQRARRAGVILLYHRVSPVGDLAYRPLDPQVFAEHIALAARHYSILPLSEFVDRMRKGQSLSGCAALTFDDGYRDFLTDAWPVLKAHAAPATHFLVADCIETGKPTWNLRLRHITLARHGKTPEGAAEQKRLSTMLARMPAADRYAWLDANEGAGALPPMLTAQDLQACDPELVEWGSHGLSHAMLARCPPEEARQELEGSRRKLEALSGRPVRYVSYPQGSYNEATIEMAKAAGYEAGFAVGQAEVARGAGLFDIQRFDVGRAVTAMLLGETTGAVEAMRRLTGRRTR